MNKTRTKFFSLIRDEGSKVPGDCGASLDQQPEWFDESKMKEATRVFRAFSWSVVLSHLLGTIIMSQVSSLVDVLLSTGQNRSLQSIAKRAVMTAYYAMEWYDGRIQDVANPARKTIKLVRNMHAKAFKIVNEQRPKPDGSVWISQYDMCLTQFAFIGALVVNPQKIGFFGTDSELESILYYWRYVGYLLGMEDKYNLCAGSYQEVKAVCQDIVEEVVRPTLANPQPLYTRTIEYYYVGFGMLSVAVSYPCFFNISCELVGCPQLKKSLTLTEFLSYWLVTILNSLMAFPCFRFPFNALYLRQLYPTIRKLKEELSRKDFEISDLEGDFSTAI